MRLSTGVVVLGAILFVVPVPVTFVVGTLVMAVGGVGRLFGM